jgi:hypothetical protein
MPTPVPLWQNLTGNPYGQQPQQPTGGPTLRSLPRGTTNFNFWQPAPAPTQTTPTTTPTGGQQPAPTPVPTQPTPPNQPLLPPTLTGTSPTANPPNYPTAPTSGLVKVPPIDPKVMQDWLNSPLNHSGQPPTPLPTYKFDPAAFWGNLAQFGLGPNGPITAPTNPPPNQSPAAQPDSGYNPLANQTGLIWNFGQFPYANTH